MGKAAKVRRLAVTVAVDGSVACIRDNAAFTRVKVWNISTFQFMNKLTSAEPREVSDRTCSRPGTLLTASSMGRVTVTCICSMGITPLSTPMTIRGKSVLGKTETGIRVARYAPAAINVSVKKMTGLAKRLVQCSGSGV